jgi:hypothetical protein
MLLIGNATTCYCFEVDHMQDMHYRVSHVEHHSQYKGPFSWLDLLQLWVVFIGKIIHWLLGRQSINDQLFFPANGISMFFSLLARHSVWEFADKYTDMLQYSMYWYWKRQLTWYALFMCIQSHF